VKVEFPRNVAVCCVSSFFGSKRWTKFGVKMQGDTGSDISGDASEKSPVHDRQIREQR